MCNHPKVRHSPNGFDIIEECVECCTATMVKGITGQRITLGGVYVTRLIEEKVKRDKEKQLWEHEA